jgi:hypothetical protein
VVDRRRRRRRRRGREGGREKCEGGGIQIYDRRRGGHE